jgi:hypothetical protein
MLVMSCHDLPSILASVVTGLVLAAAPSGAQEARCVEGCSLYEEEKALREAGLRPGDCDLAIRLELGPDGSVADVAFTRRDENELCNQTLVAFARNSRWSAAPDGAPRTMSLNWLNDPEPAAAGDSGQAEFVTYPGGMGLDSDRFFVLAHEDSHVDLTQLVERFSRLGAVERIDEVRSDSPLLCAIGRDPDGSVVFRSTALEGPARERADATFFEEAGAIWPDLELLGAHAHPQGGSCFLLRAPAPAVPAP